MFTDDVPRGPMTCFTPAFDETVNVHEVEALYDEIDHAPSDRFIRMAGRQ